MTSKQIHVPGLLLTYIGWFLGLLPGVVISWKVISGFAKIIMDLLNNPAETNGDSALAVIGISAIIAIVVLLISWLSAVVLCPVLIFIFLNDFPQHRSYVALIASAGLVLIGALIMACLYLNWIWLMFVVVLLVVILPYMAWKFADAKTRNI